MAYFIPTSIQKRLLRYALSRLELFDTDALDLENLDIAWGKLSSAELRNVGLRQAKLASLLQLPPSINIDKAEVSTLRVLIRANVTKTTVSIEIEGLRVKLKVVEREETKIQPDKRPDSADKAGQQRSRKSNVDRSRTDSSHEDRGARRTTFQTEPSEDEDAPLPTTHDLAASFLAEEPAKELEAAFKSQSTANLRESVTSDEDIDEDLAYGTGVGFTLPGFLADFLTGITNRLSIHVRDISIELDTDLEIPPDDSSEPVATSTTLGLHVDELYFGPLTMQPAYGGVNHSLLGSTLVDLDYKGFGELNWKRRVIFKGLRGTLTTEATVFEQLSKVLDTELGGVTQRSPSSSWTNNRATTPSIPQNIDSKMFRDLPAAIPTRPSHSWSTNEATGGVDVTESDSLEQQEAPRTPRAQSPSSMLAESPTFDESPPANLFSSAHGSDTQTFEERSGMLPGSLHRERSSSGSQSSNEPFKSYDNIGSSGMPPRVRMPGGFMDGESQNYESHRDQLDREHASEGEIATFMAFKEHDSEEEHQDLYESKLFSHEDAESLYMSAVGDGNLDSPEATLAQSVRDSKSPESPSSSRSQVRATGSPAKPQSSLDSITGSTGFVDNQRAAESPEPAVTTERVDSFGQSTPTAKEFLSVESITLFLPDDSASTKEVSSDDQNLAYGELDRSRIAHSTVQDIPGAFSMYAESSSSARRQEKSIGSIAAASTLKQPQRFTEQSHKAREAHPTETILSSIRICADLSTVRLFVQLQKLFQALFSNESTTENPQTTPQGATAERTRSDVYCSSLTFELRDNIEQKMETGRVLFDPVGRSNTRHNLDEALLRANISGIKYSTDYLISRTECACEIENFAILDSSKREIISFRQEARMRTSLRDINEAQENALRVKFTQSEAGLEVHASTLPLKISIDLQRLDDTFSNFGGLSGLLEVGSSVISEATITNDNPQRQSRSRAVHFDVPQRAMIEQSPRRKNKVNLRVGGLSMLLDGKRCSVKYQTSAIKAVCRDAIIAIVIDDMRFRGPFEGMNGYEPISVRIRNTSLKYLFSPEEHDLTRLISLLTPSKDKFQEDDDFLVDTLIRQRRKGAVLRLNVSHTDVKVEDLGAIDLLQDLVTEMSKMSNVTKYFPQESRPGVLTLGLLDKLSFRLQMGTKVGEISIELRQAEIAHIGLPSLVAFAIAKVSAHRNDDSPLLDEVFPQQIQGQPPMVMARLIGDDLEPALKFKLWNVCFEYSVPLIMAVLNLKEDPLEDEEMDLAASISNLAGRRELTKAATFTSDGSDPSSTSSNKLFRLDFTLRDCAIGLNPHRLSSRALFVLSDSRITTSLPFKDSPTLKMDFHKASVLIIDDHKKLVDIDGPTQGGRQASTGKHHVSDLCKQGYVSVSTISAASAIVRLISNASDQEQSLDIEFRDELFVLETCADSTKTLIETLSDLAPPMPPSKGVKYRTEIAPIQDMMASFTGDAYTLQSEPVDSFEDDDDQDIIDNITEQDLANDFDGLGDLGEFDEEIQQSQGDLVFQELGATPSQSVRTKTGRLSVGEPLENSFISGEIQLGAMPSQVQGSASKWDSVNNRYIPVSKAELSKSPLNVRIRDVHFIWNLYDGYDWQRTRETITKAVEDVETRAEEKRATRRLSANEEEDDESVIGDFLFNSIYIGVGVNHDPKDLSRQINRNIDDLASETGTHTSTVTSGRSTMQRSPRPRGRALKLERSKRHKVAFEVRGLCVDLFNFAPHEETQNSIDIRIKDVEVFDHVPTSTWKKFATYMHDAGPREEHKPMIHLEICNVRPVPELTATELVIRVTVLPLRLHVDQDALDFITRFFEFNDDAEIANTPATEQPYLQRVEVRPVAIKLDYKPKKVDYAGLRSGRSTEFMNFFILDGADILLKHTIVYGCSGFLKLHHSLEDVWMPDVRRNQLPAVLSGLNGVRTLVNVGTGVRDLIVIPIREYQKDGRIVRSISKGAVAFAKSTGSELTRFGAKLAIGAQTALQGAEGLFAKPNQEYDSGWEVADLNAEERRVVSHYADQPAGILQGLKGAARSLERDLLLTKDIIIAVAGEMREAGSAEGAARAVVRHAPTLILRPMIGASKAVGQTLMGVTNAVDPTNKRRIEDKYKRY